jgi:hypothetical protein
MSSRSLGASQLFKLLFPPDMFGEFIDIGHYVYSLESYDELAASMEQLSEDATERMQMALDELNAFKQNSHRLVRDYALIGKLGSGAYGFVWQACKENQVRRHPFRYNIIHRFDNPIWNNCMRLGAAFCYQRATSHEYLSARTDR